MASTPGQQPGEKDRDYIKRLRDAKTEEQAIRERAAQRKPESKGPDDRADDIVTNLSADLELNQFAANMFGLELDEIQRQLTAEAKAAKMPEVDSLQRQLREAGKVGWLFDSKTKRNRRVKKVLDKNKKLIKQHVKKSPWWWPF